MQCVRMDSLQTCGRCKEAKNVGDFSPSYRGKPGTWCRACFADYNRQRKHGTTPPPSVAHEPIPHLLQLGEA